MTNDEHQEMADRVYELESAIRVAEANIKDLKEERDQLSGALAEELGQGGAVFIHGGKTVAYVGPGRRSVNRELVDREAERLPPDLRPYEVSTTKYPTVGQLDKAAPFLAAAGLDSEELLVYPGRRWLMHFRDSEQV